MEETKRKKVIYKVTLIGSLVNFILAAGKLVAGIVGRSGAMVADAVHSLSDFVTDMVVLIFVNVSSKPKDESHDFGHGKFETLATVIIGLALAAVAVGIFIDSIDRIKVVLSGEIIARPGLIALIAASVSIVAKEALYWYTVSAGKRVNSPVMIANAWHHRSDAFSSIGTLIGIGGAYFLGENWRILDPIAAIIVSLLILKVAYDLIVPGLNELLEKSLPKQLEDKIIEIVTENSAICDPHNLKTRRIGNNIAIEVHVRVDKNMTVEQSHDITRQIESRIKETFGATTHIIVHIEPLK